MKKLILQIGRGTSTEELKNNLMKEITTKSTSIEKRNFLVEKTRGASQHALKRETELREEKPTINIFKVESSRKFTLVETTIIDGTIIDLEPETEYEIRTQYTQRTNQYVKWVYQIGNEKRNIQNQSTIRFKTPDSLITIEDNNFILVSVYSNKLKGQTKVLITCLQSHLEEELPEIELKNPYIIIHDKSGLKPKEVINTNKDGKVRLNANTKYRISTYGIGGESIITWTQTIDSKKPKTLHGEIVDLIPNRRGIGGKITCTIEKGDTTEGFTTLKVIIIPLPPKA